MTENRPSYNLFNSAVLNESLSQKGYVIFDLLDQSIVERMQSLFEDNRIEHDLTGFHASMYHDSVEYREKIDLGIREILMEEFVQILSTEYEALYANFMVKEPGKDSQMKLHQDWSYVEEVSADSFAFWMPLIDLNDSNGALQVLPNSHLIPNFVRGPGLDCPLIDQWKLIEQKFLEPVFLKKGQAIVWQHRLAHCSPTNQSEKSRIAATTIIVPKEEKIVHYFKENDQSEVEVYGVDRSFYMNYRIANKPDALLKEKINYSFRPLSKSDLYKLTSDGEYDPSIIDRIKTMIFK